MALSRPWFSRQQHRYLPAFVRRAPRYLSFCSPGRLLPKCLKRGSCRSLMVQQCNRSGPGQARTTPLQTERSLKREVISERLPHGTPATLFALKLVLMLSSLSPTSALHQTECCCGCCCCCGCLCRRPRHRHRQCLLQRLPDLLWSLMSLRADQTGRPAMTSHRKADDVITSELRARQHKHGSLLLTLGEG